MLSFANAPGNLFNIIGSLGALVKNLYAYQQTQLTKMTSTSTGCVVQLASESDLQALIGSAYIGQLSAPEAIAGLAQQVAISALNRLIFRDQPQLSQTLDQLNTLASLQELIRQMQVAGASVLAMNVTATPGSIVGVGNGILNASVRRPSDGLVLENSFPENLTLTCTTDSYTGGAVAGNEGFTLTGEGQQTDVFAFNWPLGSNAQTGLSAIDGDASQTSGNFLNKSNFSTWTGNIPDQWTLAVGTAGTNIQQESTLTYGSGSSVRLIGDGSTLTQLRQVFGSSAGTTLTLDPVTQYGVCLFLRRDGTAPASGVLTVDLMDGNSNVIADEAGNPCSFSIDLTQLTVTYTGYIGQFRTPIIMPSTYYFRLRLSTALTTGRSVYIGKVSCGPMTQSYVSGPYVSVHAGSNPFVANDYGRIAINNSFGAGGTLSTFQVWMNQIFGMQQNDLLLPSAAVPSISDGLIS